MDSLDALHIQLHRDYAEVCEAGLRRRPEATAQAEQAAAVDRLIAAGLVVHEGGYLTLQRPEYGEVEFAPEALALLQTEYERWLHAEPVSLGEQLLYGQVGFWQHWWNLMHERGDGPLRMDLLIADVPGIAEFDWNVLLRRDLLHEVVAQGVLELRLLLPPCDEESPVGEMGALLSRVGFDVRVRSSPFLFAVYNGKAAVLSDGGGSDGSGGNGAAAGGMEGYFLTRRSSIVAPLQRVFEQHWASAIPWEAFTRGVADVLELMSLGWTDARIAEAMGLSTRTVTRRVADAMAAAGVSSRFELGIRYAQSKG